MNNSSFFLVSSTNQGPCTTFTLLINSEDDINADGRQKRPREDDIDAEDL